MVGENEAHSVAVTSSVPQLLEPGSAVGGGQNVVIWNIDRVEGVVARVELVWYQEERGVAVEQLRVARS